MVTPHLYVEIAPVDSECRQDELSKGLSTYENRLDKFHAHVCLLVTIVM